MDYRIDYGPINPAAARQAAAAPLYAAVDGRVASLGVDEMLFFDPATNRNHVMTRQVLQALSLCNTFQPMERHVQRVAAEIAGLKGQETAVRRVLEGMATRGLLITADAFLTRFERVQPETLAPPTAVFIRACNRPPQLRELLASLHAHGQRHGSRYRTVLVDDSTDTDAVRDHATLLRQFGEAAGCVVAHIERGRWQAICDDLASAVPQHADALRALLVRDAAYRGRRGGGIGKNLITLLAAGERYLLLDDDFRFPLKRHPEYRPGLGLDQQAWAVRTQADHAAAFAAGDDIDADPLALQLALCGQTLAGALGRVEGFSLDRDSLLGMAAAKNRALAADARIQLTINGHRGAAGASGLIWLYMLDPAARAAIVADAARYASNRDDPPVWFGTRQFLLGSGSNFTPFAVDNRRLLPPTSPFGRSEDTLFNALVVLAHADAQLLDVPFSIGHLQEGRRDRSALLTQPETPDINICIAELARHVGSDVYAAAPAPRLALLAARLDDLAGGDDATLVPYLHEYLTYRRSLAVEQLQRVAAASPDLPEFFAADLRSLIETNGRAVAERQAPRFAGWAENATAADCAAAYRREAGVLADGLRAWPAAWEAALSRREGWLQSAAL